jgi:cell division protein FtsL
MGRTAAGTTAGRGAAAAARAGRAAPARTAGRAAPARRHPAPRRRSLKPLRAPRRRVSGYVDRRPTRGILVLPRGARILDALLTGRVWIALVGVLLAGIVFFNVDLLRMDRDITRMADRSDQLKRENARIREEGAHLGSSERIQEAAAELGLVLPAPGDVRYLKSNPKLDARTASKRIIAPIEGYIPATTEPEPPLGTTTSWPSTTSSSPSTTTTTTTPPTSTTTPTTTTSPTTTTTPPPATSTGTQSTATPTTGATATPGATVPGAG